VEHVICHDASHHLLDFLWFNYTKPSDAVDFLKNQTEHREWFSSVEAIWNNEENPKFTEIITRNGLGFTFNLMEDADLFYENRSSNDFRYSYGDESPRDKRPWSTGAQMGSKLWATIYRLYYDNDYYCQLPKFSVHSPFELPKISSFKIFDAGMKLNVWITPEIIQSDDDLRSFDPDERKCYFEGERKLNYFKVYTQRNCESECLSFAGEV
jgi:acid-sensing ion channel, other